MKHKIIVSTAAVLLFGPYPARAQDSACRPIIDANKAQWQAPMVHDRKVMDSGFTLETIKLGDALYMKSGAAWRTMPPAMAHALTNFAAIEKSGLQMKDCKQEGRETIGGIPTRIYSFTTVVPSESQESGRGKVWIGNDGLPYRMEANKVKGTVVYTGVTAPKLN